MKTCACCKVSKPLSDFPPRPNRPCGVHSTCIPCRKVQQREYYRKHRAVRVSGWVPRPMLDMGEPEDRSRALTWSIAA